MLFGTLYMSMQVNLIWRIPDSDPLYAALGFFLCRSACCLRYFATNSFLVNDFPLVMQSLTRMLARMEYAL